MTLHDHQASLQSTRRDARDVIDELRGLEFGQFHRHVTADTNDVIVLQRERGAVDEVRVGVHRHDLLAIGDLNRTDAIVERPERQQRPFVVEAGSVERVEPNRVGSHKFPLRHVPELNLTEQRRGTAGRGELRPIGREPNRVDPWRPTNEATGRFAAVSFVQHDLVITRNRQQRAVGRKRQRRDHG